MVGIRSLGIVGTPNSLKYSSKYLRALYAHLEPSNVGSFLPNSSREEAVPQRFSSGSGLRSLMVQPSTRHALAHSNSPTYTSDSCSHRNYGINIPIILGVQPARAHSNDERQTPEQGACIHVLLLARPASEKLILLGKTGRPNRQLKTPIPQPLPAPAVRATPHNSLDHNSPRASKYPVFEVSGSNKHTLNGSGGIRSRKYSADYLTRATVSLMRGSSYTEPLEAQPYPKS